MLRIAFNCDRGLRVIRVIITVIVQVHCSVQTTLAFKFFVFHIFSNCFVKGQVNCAYKKEANITRDKRDCSDLTGSLCT